MAGRVDMSSTDLQALITFLAQHCAPGAGNPLSILSAAQLLRELPRAELIMLRNALEDSPLDAGLEILMAQRLQDISRLRAA